MRSDEVIALEQALRRTRLVLLDGMQSHDCAGRGECWCDDGWPLFGLAPGNVAIARRLLQVLEKEKAP